MPLYTAQLLKREPHGDGDGKLILFTHEQKTVGLENFTGYK
jgi:hypothetical protein